MEIIFLTIETFGDALNQEDITSISKYVQERIPDSKIEAISITGKTGTLEKACEHTESLINDYIWKMDDYDEITRVVILFNASDKVSKRFIKDIALLGNTELADVDRTFYAIKNDENKIVIKFEFD